jgi:hypothetical protein
MKKFILKQNRKEKKLGRPMAARLERRRFREKKK